MKKLFTLIVGLTLGLPAFASAASFVVTPATGSYSVGDNVTLNISVDPEGGVVYAAMLDARFTSDIFDVESFTLNPDILAFKQPGYDAIDNTKGVLTKTGGYAGGTKKIAPFGTLVLRAKKIGAGSLTIVDTSKLLDVNGNNQQKGELGVSVTVVAAKPALQAPEPVVSTSTVNESTTTVPNTGSSVVTPESNTFVSTSSSSTVATVATPSTKNPVSQLATVIAATAGKNSLILGALVALLVVVWSFYFAYTRNLFASIVKKFRK